MNTRLQQFLAAENISQSQFADSIGVARASVSHIISGRNKPGFDFIENMARRYPALNLDWIVTGKGKMYRTDAQEPYSGSLFAEPEHPAAITQPSVFEPEPEDLPVFEDEEPVIEPVRPKYTAAQPAARPVQTSFEPVRQASKAAVSPATSRPEQQKQPSVPKAITLDTSSESPKNNRSISRIIVLYDDGTYQELK